MTTLHGLSVKEIPSCYLHPDVQSIHIWTKDGFEYLQCPDCGLVWVNPQLTDEAASEIYRLGFKGMQGRHPIYPGKNRFREGLSFIAPYQQNGRVLDVGTFTGHFLVAAREDGWQEPEGTEISQEAAGYAREEYGLTMHIGDLLSLDLPQNHYDAVTLSDVIEHVSDPLDTIQYIHKLLRDGGCLYMHTPHFNSIPRYIYGKRWNVFFPWHRTIFTANAMREMLEQNGFRVKTLNTVGILPIGTGSAWQDYLKQKQLEEAQTETFSQGGKPKYSLLRNLLRPAWLGTKQLMQWPFLPLSAMNIHIGARLVVCAEKIG